MFVNSYLAFPKFLSPALCCSLCTPPPLSLIISKHKEIKFHFYADDKQVYIHLSQKNASAAFEKLNRCLYDIKEWMSTSKLKLNPDKSEFIIFGSKMQRDRLKAYFPIDILGNSLCPVDSVKNLDVWFDSDFSLSKHVQNVCKSCFIKLFLCLWLMLLLVAIWITATHFSGASPSSIYANYSASKIVQPELYVKLVDTPV